MIIGQSHRTVPGLERLAQLLKEAHDHSKDLIVNHNIDRGIDIRDKIAQCIFELECFPLNYEVKVKKINHK